MSNALDHNSTEALAASSRTEGWNDDARKEGNLDGSCFEVYLKRSKWKEERERES